MAVANGVNPDFDEVGVGGVIIETGAGVPAHTRPKGSLYIRTDGSSGTTRIYINTDGATTWTTVTTTA